MIKRFKMHGACAFVWCLPFYSYADYTQHEQAQTFINKMITEHDFSAAELNVVFESAEKKQSIIDAMSRPAEKTKTWKEYRKIFIKDRRINGGVKFWLENKQALQKAEETYGVPAEYIVSIIGVETLYGRITGSYRVVDALSTLAFDYPKRSPFFTKELEHYLLLTKQQEKDPLAFKGSYAGAMGYGQFMPSSYRSYAVDFDGDNFADIWNNTTDAIGSVANYFKRHGWTRGEYVTVRGRPSKEFNFSKAVLKKPKEKVSQWKQKGLVPVEPVPDNANALVVEFEGKHGIEYWLGFNNFYTITRYNHSPMYALAVHQLAEKIYDKAQGKLGASE